MIVLFLAASHTSEIKTEEEGKACGDASQGFGELETNDPDYALKYLIMPENVMAIREDIKTIRKLSGYSIHYDPTLTDNN